MKNILMSILEAIYLFSLFVLMLILMFIVFIPVLPIMLLAFPMMVMNEGEHKVHWTQKPYLWYFKNVWLRLITFIELI